MRRLSNGELEDVPHCSKCDRWKPERAHHCRSCGVCVLKMDHHCPWVNNCVGFGNYRYFYSFLLWGVIGMSFFLVGVRGDLGTLFLHTNRRRQVDQNGPLPDVGGDSHLPPSAFLREDRLLVYVAVTLDICLLIGVAGLLGTHTYLILSNQTTIEFSKRGGIQDALRLRGKLFRTPYNLGRTRNLQQVFGRRASLWPGLWLFSWIRVDFESSLDGCRWPRVDQLLPV